ncbi:MAG: metal ABC transporter substrate-binding protein [Sphaerochaetaceae bacterium]
MKRKSPIFFCIVLVLLLLTGCNQQKDKTATSSGTGKEQPHKLSVFASFYPMYDFASKIGGDKVQVTNMIPSGTEPHDWEPATTDITNLEKADVFIYNGAGMEHWAEVVLASLQNKKLIAVEASKGVSLREGSPEEGEEASAKSGESSYDPHVWLSPLNAKSEMENIKEAFIQADPANKDYYEKNFAVYSAKFDTLDKEFHDTLAPLPNKDIIVAHQAFGYLCAAYGLNQIPIEGLSPDSEPDPARMAEIIDFAKSHKVNVIFFEELISPKVAQTIAKAIGAKTEVLNPLEGLSDTQQAAGEDYFSVMRQNLQTLKTALE